MKMSAPGVIGADRSLGAAGREQTWRVVAKEPWDLKMPVTTVNRKKSRVGSNPRNLC